MASFQFSRSVMSDFATPWTAACHASLSITNSQSLLQLTSIESVRPSNQLAHPLSSPSPSAFNLSQHQGLFQRVSSSHQVAKVTHVQVFFNCGKINVTEVATLTVLKCEVQWCLFGDCTCVREGPLSALCCLHDADLLQLGAGCSEPAISSMSPRAALPVVASSPLRDLELEPVAF